MEKLIARGEMLAGQRLAKTRSEVKSALADALPEDVDIAETAEGIRMQARHLNRRLAGNSGLRDIAFLMRSVR